MRLFLALELPSAAAEEIAAATAPLREAEPGLAWVPAHKLHLTLKFLGDGDDARAAALSQMLDRVAAQHRPFEMTLAGVGAFPNFRRPRVVWMGVDGDSRLELLHHDVEIAAEQAGYELEGRPFRPHVTLARVREPLPAERVRALARVARGIDHASTEYVDRLTLFDSVAGDSGAHYRRLHAATLGGR
ncbi:MAG TPA: RNA 2',3'-cyclic phosphodiesterase [Gemmatimonadaceae bacterium]|nr:RNA 2',3'-cyclic phosphodiesterase [Gemmatimonadaceae bacterium]